MSADQQSRKGGGTQRSSEGDSSNTPKRADKETFDIEVNKGGRLTIPHRIRWFLGIEEGDLLYFKVDGDGFILGGVEKNGNIDNDSFFTGCDKGGEEPYEKKSFEREVLGSRQLTIPHQIRWLLGLEHKTCLKASIEGSVIEFRKVDE